MESANAFAEEFMNVKPTFFKSASPEFDVHRNWMSMMILIYGVLLGVKPAACRNHSLCSNDKYFTIIEDNEFSRRAIGKYIDVCYYLTDIKSSGNGVLSTSYSHL